MMDGKTPPRVLPKLRFPEFAHEPAWECPPLTKLAKRVTKRNTEDKDLRPLTNSAEHGVVDQREFFDKDIATTTDNYFVVEPGDYVYNPRVSETAPVGPISRNAVGTGVMSPLYTVFRFRSDAHDYFAQYFKSSHWHQYLRRISNSGARHDRMAITNDDFMAMPIPTPKPAEQQKIADCLGSLDDLIAAEGRKLDALRRHKQGLMQQLFPQPGETVPRLRFPEFEDAPDWEAADFGEAVFFQEGPGIMAADFRDNGVPLVRLSGLSGQTVTLDGCNYLDSETVSRKWNHFRLAIDDLLVSCSATFGRPARVTPEAAGAVFYTGLVRFRPNDERIELDYLETFLGSPNFLKQAESHAVGGGIKHFGPTHLKQMKMPLPPLPAEQKRIAACLSPLDAQIAAQSRKLEGLRTHKRGLMQQLFPDSEAR